MRARSMIGEGVLVDHVAAVSCGIVGGAPVLDLDYAEDSQAGTDANFVMTGAGGLVEVQGTAEGAPFSEEDFLRLLALARAGIRRLVDLQKLAVALSIAMRLAPGPLVVASHNPGKVREIVDLLGPFGFEVSRRPSSACPSRRRPARPSRRTRS